MRIYEVVIYKSAGNDEDRQTETKGRKGWKKVEKAKR